MDNIRTDDLPLVLQDVAAAIGMEATVRLAQQYGGLQMYVPTAYPPSHEILELLGSDAAVALARRYGGMTLYLPRLDTARRAARDREILAAYYDRGESARQIARDWGISQRRVLWIVNERRVVA